MAHEIIALELLTVLLENPTDDSVEVAVGFVTECGSILQDLSPKGLHGMVTLESSCTLLLLFSYLLACNSSYNGSACFFLFPWKLF